MQISFSLKFIVILCPTSYVNKISLAQFIEDCKMLHYYSNKL